MNFLSEPEARNLVEQYLKIEGSVSSTQEIVDSIPRLKGFGIHPGKVSDSIYGGLVRYKDKETGKMVEFENPELVNADGMPLRLMVRSERISTHDVNRGDIPFKDQILALNHNLMRRIVMGEIGTSQFDIPGLEDNAIVIGAENLKTIPVENVFRAYMQKTDTTTSLFVAYVLNGKRDWAGHKFPEGLMINGKLPELVDTPSTKSTKDITIDPQYLFDHGLCTPEQYMQIKNAGRAGYGAAAAYLLSKGLVLVDTKTEHGINSKGQIVSQDELYNMDSSRIWDEDDYQTQLELFLEGKTEELIAYLKATQPGISESKYMHEGVVHMAPKSFDKEYARQFKAENKAQGIGDVFTPDQRVEIGTRYIMGIQRLTGKRFEPDMRPRDERVATGLETVVRSLAA